MVQVKNGKVTKATVYIANMRSRDWQAISRIYQEGIETGDATFETKVPSWRRWDEAHRHDCRLVAIVNDEIVGYAALSPVSTRRVYAGVAEVSVYVACVWRNQGIGKQLLNALVKASEVAGIWTLRSSIFPENKASLIVHERCGFRRVGRHERISQTNGVWRDTILMERRSDVIGVD